MKTKILAVVLPVLIVVLVLISVDYRHRSGEITAEQEAVSITGTYGTEIPYTDISSVAISEHIPRIKARTNGYSFRGTMKGFFSVDGWGRTLLFIHKESNGPFLVITNTDGRNTVYRTDDPQQAGLLYSYISERIAREIPDDGEDIKTNDL